MRNLMIVAVFAAVCAFSYIGTAEAGLFNKGGCGGGCGHEKHCHHHSDCGAPTCGAPTCGAPTCGTGCGVTTGCATGHCYAPTGGCTSGLCGVAYSVPAQTTATLVVTLPADAKLLIDGNATTSQTAHRVFETPALQSGIEFNYTLEAQVVVDGKTETITKNVTVRAGEETVVAIEMPTAVAAR